MSLRGIEEISKAIPTREGAGVSLYRAFGFGKTSEFDPFLLLDDFRNDDPTAYQAGFPWHPHRGIETITYVLAGKVEHGDSLGNSGVIGPGAVQWMTAGRGIIHQEMPAGDAEGRMHGFQLWANLPKALKMGAPRYQEFGPDRIPVANGPDGVEARVICGELWGTQGPVEGIGVDPAYFDISLSGVREIEIPVAADRHAFAYIFQGEGDFCNLETPLEVPSSGSGWSDIKPDPHASNRTLIRFGDGDRIRAKSGAEALRFLLFSGKPLKEPVAWYGPIVMNTQGELKEAFRQIEEGTFLEH